MENQKDDYLPEHYPENQTCESVEDIFINPHLRESFNSTPNNDRDSLEWEHWYGRPFIEVDEHSEESYQDYVKRMSSIGIEIKLDTESQFYERQKELKDAWLKAWPTGKRYDVRCLTGGAWDRSSSLGMFASLGEAIERCYQDITLYGCI